MRIGLGTARRLSTTAIALALVVCAPNVPRQGLEAVQLRLAAADPAALSSLRLSRLLTPALLSQEIDAALEAGDADLARSFLFLAEEEGVAVSPEVRARVEAASGVEPLRAAQDLALGFAVGETESVSGLVGAVTGDLVGYGDLRDLFREGAKAWRGENVDELLVGLSVVGLALTGVTWASAGTALPARGGISAIKSARLAGHVSGPLAAYATRAAKSAVDQNAVKATLAAAKRLDAAGARTAARNALRPSGLKALASLSDDAAAIYSRTGARGLKQGLRVAENGDDVRRLAKLADARGPSTRAVLKVLGRGALVLGSILGTLASWSLALLAYVVGVAFLARRTGLWLGRVIWRLPPRRPRPTPAFAST